MAYIRETANGKWQAEIYMGRDADGKIIRKYITRSGKKECQLAAMKIEIEVAEKSLSNVSKMRVVSWFESYLEMNEHEFAPSTMTLYLSFLKNHYTPYFGRTTLDKVNRHHLQRFQSNLLDTLSPSTVNRIMGALQASFLDALGNKSPFDGFQVVRPNAPDTKAPTTEEFLLIREAVKGSRYEIPVLLAGWCGFRRSEILALRENDIDFARGSVRIDEAWSKSKNGNYVLKAPKSQRGLRTERVPEELMTMLKGLINKDDKVVQLKPTGEDFLFSSRPDTFTTSYRKFLQRRDAPRFTFHELRHYHATWLFENDIPDKYAAKRMGQTVEVLRTTYQHLGLEKQKELDEKILEIAKTAPAK